MGVLSQTGNHGRIKQLIPYSSIVSVVLSESEPLTVFFRMVNGPSVTYMFKSKSSLKTFLEEWLTEHGNVELPESADIQEQI